MKLLRLRSQPNPTRPAILLFLCMSFFGCSRSEKQPLDLDNPAQEDALGFGENHLGGSRSDFGKAGAEELRAAAEAGVAPAQRELAARMLFGKGMMPADPAAAIVWVERAARGGDATARLWMGRKHLNEPPDRVAAAAWFLLAADRDDPAIQQDVAGELEALALSAVELDQARSLKAKLEAEIRRSSK